MILQKIAAVDDALERLSSVERVRQQLTTLDPVRREVSEWADELTAKAELFRIFAERALVSDGDKPNPRRLREAIQRVRRNLSESPLKVTSGASYKTVQKHAKQTIAELTRLLTVAWEAWLDRTIPRIDDAELETYGHWDGYRTVVADIKAARELLHRRRRRLPETETEFAEAAELSERMRAAIRQLP